MMCDEGKKKPTHLPLNTSFSLSLLPSLASTSSPLSLKGNVLPKDRRKRALVQNAQAQRRYREKLKVKSGTLETRVAELEGQLGQALSYKQEADNLRERVRLLEQDLQLKVRGPSPREAALACSSIPRRQVDLGSPPPSPGAPLSLFPKCRARRPGRRSCWSWS